MQKQILGQVVLACDPLQMWVREVRLLGTAGLQRPADAPQGFDGHRDEMAVGNAMLVHAVTCLPKE